MIPTASVLPETCDVFNHRWKETYYGFTCEVCGQFVPPDFFAPMDDTAFDDESEDGHSQECTCDVCLQNYPERNSDYWMDDGH